MRRVFNIHSIFVAGLALVGLLIAISLQSADARPQYNKAFQKKYPKVTAAKKLKCNVCHMGKKKKPRNPYGKVLEKLVKKNEKDAKKIDEALTKAGATKIKKDGKETYGDRLKAGKLPYEAAK